MADPDMAARDTPGAETGEIFRRIATRTRRARKTKDISRRVLAERSGVSSRTLAQLEAGTGNISIRLLQRIASALETKLEYLLVEDDPWGGGAAGRGKAQRICLIGLRGAGKSTLGGMAAQRLGIPFIELNRDIADHTGMPLAEVMALYGPEGYRNLEAESLDRILARYDRAILAVSGGIVESPATFGMLLRHFHTIWLQADAREHMERVRKQGDTRPMAGREDALAQLRGILQSREAHYRRADAVLDTTGKQPADSLAGLIALITARGFLDGGGGVQ